MRRPRAAPEVPVRPGTRGRRSDRRGGERRRELSRRRPRVDCDAGARWRTSRARRRQRGARDGRCVASGVAAEDRGPDRLRDARSCAGLQRLGMLAGRTVLVTGPGEGLAQLRSCSLPRSRPSWSPPGHPTPVEDDGHQREDAEEPDHQDGPPRVPHRAHTHELPDGEEEQAKDGPALHVPECGDTGQTQDMEAQDP